MINSKTVIFTFTGTKEFIYLFFTPLCLCILCYPNTLILASYLLIYKGPTNFSYSV